jgi:hypothetical protein
MMVFNNISVLSWRPVLVVEESGVPGENHRPWASNWLTFITYGCKTSAPFFVITTSYLGSCLHMIGGLGL